MATNTKIVIKPVMPRKHPMTNQLEYLKKSVLPTLKKMEYAFLFFMKVNPNDFPTYPDIVKKPMDFSVIETRLKENHYESGAECVDDINTIFANCCIFSQAAEDITLISEQLLREKFLKKMEDFPQEEFVLERKKRGPGRKRTALSPVGASIDSDSHVSTRRQSGESIESQSNPPFLREAMVVSPAANGEAKISASRNSIISRISKDAASVPPLKVSNVPARREREARSLASAGVSGISGISTLTESKPRIKLSPSLNRCLKIITDIQHYRRRSFNWPFLEPVDPVKLKLPDYFQIVTNPMDLSTIKKNLESGVYTHRNQVKEHIDLMINNCVLYNGIDSAVAEAGKALGEYFNSKFSVIPDDVEPSLTGSKRHKHKHHKGGKRHKRDRSDDEFYRFVNLSPESGPQFLPEEMERINSILNKMQDLLEKVQGCCSELDGSNRVLSSLYEKRNDDGMTVTPSNFESVIKQFQTDLNSLRNLPGIFNSSNLTNGAVGGSGGSGRSAGRPRKRTLPTDGNDLEMKTSTPAARGPNATGRGKRKRLNNTQPIPNCDETSLGLSGAHMDVDVPVQEPVVQKVANGKANTIASTLLSNASAMEAAQTEKILSEQKPQKDQIAAPCNQAPNNESANQIAESLNLMGEYELTYAEKAELSEELGQISDPTLLSALVSIIQRHEPHVQIASSGDLDVDLTAMKNSTLIELKRAMERAKSEAVLDEAAETGVYLNPSGPQYSAKKDDPVLSEDEMLTDEDDEPEDAEENLSNMPETDSSMPSQPAALLASRVESSDDNSVPPGAGGDLSGSYLESDQGDTKPRGRRNRKAVNPVRHRGAATVLGVSGSAATGGSAKEEPATEPDPASADTVPSTKHVKTSASEAANPENKTSEAHRNKSITSSTASSVLEMVLDQETTPLKNTADTKPVSLKKSPTEDEKDLSGESKAKDNQSTSSTKMESSNLSDSDSDEEEDMEKESPCKSDDGRSLVDPMPPRHSRVIDIFENDDGRSSNSSRRPKNTSGLDDLEIIKQSFSNVIIKHKTKMITSQVELENQKKKVKAEEEQQKREIAEKKKQEEREKEARKEVLKEQERKRLNEIRARNRRADMPLRQYADMANFEKKLDFNLLSPRWV